MPDTIQKPDDSLAGVTAKKTLSYMAEHGIDPTPPNYTLWFEYALGHNRALVKEMKRLIAEETVFTPEIGNVLYERYIANAGMAEAAHSSASSAKQLLGKVQRLMTDFGGQTANYNHELDRAVETMTGEFTAGPELQGMMQEIVKSAVSLRESGEALNRQLQESQQEIEQLKVNLATVTTESEKDHLTGLANRKALDRRLQELTRQAVEEKGELSLLMLDIDHFKQFNDRFGHLIGDEVLKIVARAMTDTVRGKDMVARYGGEEFAVLLPQTPVGGAMIVAESIRKTIASRDLKRKDTGENYGGITVSIGVAHLHGRDDAPGTLMKRADDALYRSKKSGRNLVTQESVGG